MFLITQTPIYCSASKYVNDLSESFYLGLLSRDNSRVREVIGSLVMEMTIDDRSTLGPSTLIAVLIRDQRVRRARAGLPAVNPSRDSTRYERRCSRSLPYDVRLLST